MSGRGRAEPSNSLERELLELCRAAIGNDEIGVRDDFFDVGGTSLKAVELVADVNGRFALDLPAEAVWRAPTAVQLSQLVRDTRYWTSSTLVPVQVTPRGTPLAVVHGAGYPGFVHALARRYPERSVFAFRPALSTRRRPLDRIEAMAERYVHDWIQREVREPIVLCGYCSGGLVAIEMAGRLAAMGRAVESIVLLDTPVPSRRSPDQLARDADAIVYDMVVGGSARAPAFDEYVRMSREERVTRMIDCWRLRGVVLPGARGRRLVREHLAVSEANVAAMLRYRLPDLGGYPPILLVSAESPEGRPEDLGWGAVASRLSVFRAPGSHETLFQPDPFTVVDACIRQALSTR